MYRIIAPQPGEESVPGVLGIEVQVLRDSLLEGDGFELVWGFSCQELFWLSSLLWQSLAACRLAARVGVLDITGARVVSPIAVPQERYNIARCQ